MLASLIKSHLLGKSYFSLLPAKASLASFLSGALASLASLLCLSHLLPSLWLNECLSVCQGAGYCFEATLLLPCLSLSG